MAVRTEVELEALFASLFTSNGNNEITALKLRQFCADLVDTMFNGFGSGGAGSLADTLAVGNITGANDIDITAARAVRWLAGAFNQRLQGAPTANRTLSLPDMDGVLEVLHRSPYKDRVISRITDPSLITPPTVAGYIVLSPGAGDFVGQEDKIARTTDGGATWTFYTPVDGDMVYVQDEGAVRLTWEFSSWQTYQQFTSYPSLSEVTTVGATAVATLLLRLIALEDHAVVHSSAGNIALDFTRPVNYVILQADGVMTYLNPTSENTWFYVILEQDATGGRAVTWAGSKWVCASGKPLRIATAPNARTMFRCFYFANTVMVVENVSTLVEPGQIVKTATHTVAGTHTLHLDHTHHRISATADITLAHTGGIQDGEEYIVEIINTGGADITLTLTAAVFAYDHDFITFPDGAVIPAGGHVIMRLRKFGSTLAVLNFHYDIRVL